MSKKVYTVVTPQIKALEKLLINKPKIKPKWKNSFTISHQTKKKKSINEQPNMSYQAPVSQSLISESTSTLFDKSINKEHFNSLNKIQEMDGPIKNTSINKKKHDLHKNQLLENTPISSLEKRLSLSPFAAMLASPMRTCTFHRKPYPSDLLMRFSVGIHPITKKQWGYPSMYESNGRGYYVKLNHKIIDELSKKEYKRLFRGAAEFPKQGMAEYVHELLTKRVKEQVEKTLSLFAKLNLNGKYTKGDDVITTNHFKWKYDHPNTNTTKSNSFLYQNGFHCIIILSHVQPPNVMNTFPHSIEGDQNTPFLLLDVREQPWLPILELLKSKIPFDHSKPMAVAVPKTKETIPLMIDLWRLEECSGKGKSFIINKLTNE